MTPYDNTLFCHTQEKEVAPVVAGFWERAEFPHALLPKYAALNLAGGAIKGYGCPVRALLCSAASLHPHHVGK